MTRVPPDAQNAKGSSEGTKVMASSPDKAKPKDKRDRNSPPTKVVVRRLPPSMTMDTFVEQVSPLPDHDYIYFVKADMNLGQFAFSRAYINFINQQDIFIFKDKFDGYVFLDQKGNEYPAVVEFAPFQKVPKQRVKKKDAKCGTIEQDQEYIKFLESLQSPEEVSLPSAETYLEEIEARERELRANNGVPKMTTPLIEYVKQKKLERQRLKEEKREERKRRELERKKQKEEERIRRKEMKDKEAKEREREREKRKSGSEHDKKDSAKDKEDKVSVVKRSKYPETSPAPSSSCANVKYQSVAILKPPKQEKQSEKTEAAEGKMDREDEERYLQEGTKMLRELLHIGDDPQQPSKEAVKSHAPRKPPAFRGLPGFQTHSGAPRQLLKNPERDKEKDRREDREDRREKGLHERERDRFRRREEDRLKQRESRQKDRRERMNRPQDERPYTRDKDRDRPQRPGKGGREVGREGGREGGRESGREKEKPSLPIRPEAGEGTTGRSPPPVLPAKEEGGKEKGEKEKQMEEADEEEEAEGSENSVEKGTGNGDARTQARKEAAERRAERRIRNKDRPSIEIYRPGMGRLSSQRKTGEKEEKDEKKGEGRKEDSPVEEASTAVAAAPTTTIEAPSEPTSGPADAPTAQNSKSRNSKEWPRREGKPHERDETIEVRSMTFKRTISRE